MLEVRFATFCDEAQKEALIPLGLFFELVTFCDVLRRDFAEVVLILNGLGANCTKTGAGFFCFI